MSTIHDVRDILSLVPEMIPLVKQAQVLDNELLLDTPADALLSAVRVEHMLKIAHIPVDRDTYDRVQMATRLHGVESLAAHACSRMSVAAQGLVKAASLQDQLTDSIAMIEGSLCGYHPDMGAITKAAEHLVENYGDMAKSATVRRLGLGDVFVPALASAFLSHREALAPGVGYGDLARAMEKSAAEARAFSRDEVREICSSIRALDELTGMREKGFDLYKEAFLTKEAACSVLTVKLAGKLVPVESLLRLPIDRLLGDDIAQAINGDPQQAKAVLESLPLEQQSLLASRV